MARARKQSVRAAVLRDLAAIRKADAALADGGLAALAVSLAEQMDSPGTTGTERASCARALTQALAELRELAPPKKKEDAVDELKQRREQRRRAADGGAGT
ncbi:hypothetical protein [Paraconexibacter algicola]|uniref:Uncharacterized protein n=1 Tax=Paraconexibacter algicola TaxID=2133960 RepID=A0A2T4UE95_9ACTN|nr:hypothetical protein [Paraconexibacter algicola]PTL55742.1 hypothetical protein C7Y72_19120 [Paraconexibacter algicola]